MLKININSKLTSEAIEKFIRDNFKVGELFKMERNYYGNYNFAFHHPTKTNRNSFGEYDFETHILSFSYCDENLNYTDHEIEINF